MNTAQFQRVARLATIGSQLTSERGADVLNLMLEHARLNGNVTRIAGVELKCNTSGTVREGLLFLRVEVYTKTSEHPLTVWLEVNSADQVAFDFS